MNENEFEIDGVKHKAKQADDALCCGCAFLKGKDCNAKYHSDVPECLRSHRADHRNVIFVKVKP